MSAEGKSERELLEKSKGKHIYYDCSNCGWYFEFSKQVDPPPGQTEEQQREIHRAQRDKAFREHDCSKYPKAKNT
jgi:hypothetical protein